MYKATKQWQSNRYLQQLMRDGVFYFLLYATLFPLFHFHSSRSHTSAGLTLECPHENSRVFPRDSRNVLLTLYKVLQSQLASTDASLHFLTSVSYIILFPMMPRFIISIRELRDRDLRDHWQGIDTGLGVLSHPVVSENAVVSAITFADVTSWQGQGRGQGRVVVGDADDSETIWVGVLGDGMGQGVEGDADDSKAIRLGVFRDGTRQV